jgi:hypothetical protein
MSILSYNGSAIIGALSAAGAPWRKPKLHAAARWVHACQRVCARTPALVSRARGVARACGHAACLGRPRHAQRLLSGALLHPLPPRAPRSCARQSCMMLCPNPKLRARTRAPLP